MSVERLAIGTPFSLRQRPDNGEFGQVRWSLVRSMSPPNSRYKEGRTLVDAMVRLREVLVPDLPGVRSLLAMG